MSTHTEVLHQPEKSRYVIKVDGREAGYASYEDRSETLRDFNHTVVDPAFRGQGLSSMLIHEALRDTRVQDKKVRPTCSAVEHFINKNEEFADLVED